MSHISLYAALAMLEAARTCIQNNIDMCDPDEATGLHEATQLLAQAQTTLTLEMQRAHNNRENAKNGNL